MFVGGRAGHEKRKGNLKNFHNQYHQPHSHRSGRKGIRNESRWNCWLIILRYFMFLLRLVRGRSMYNIFSNRKIMLLDYWSFFFRSAFSHFLRETLRPSVEAFHYSAVVARLAHSRPRPFRPLPICTDKNPFLLKQRISFMGLVILWFLIVRLYTVPAG